MKKSRAILPLLVFAVIVSGCVTPQPFNTYFVSKQGNDDNDGSEEHPWLTIQKAADSVRPGDTVYVKKGTYKESIVIDISGEPDKRITFTNFENDKVNVVAKSCHGFYVEADYITIRGFNISNAYYRENANCADWTASGITTHRSNNIFENNEISNSLYGIMLRANIGEDFEGGVIWPTEGSNVIRNNYIHDTDYSAVRVKRSNNNIVEDNKFYYNHLKLSSFNDKEGNILFYTEAPLVFYCLNGLRIENNEFYEPKFGPAILELDMVTRTSQAPSMAPNPDETKCPLNIDNVVIKDNIVFKTENLKYMIILTLGRDFALGSGHVIDNNVWFNGNPDSKIIEWGYNFWHDNNEDDGINPEVWTLKEFQENTGFDENSKDTIEPYCGDNNCDDDESCSSCPADCRSCPAPSGESHFGVHAEISTYSQTNNLIKELGDIYIRNGFRDNVGWRTVKGNQNIGICKSCCPDCDCNSGDMFYCDISRDELISTGMFMDFYNSDYDFNLFVTVGANRYDDIPPKTITATYPANEETYKEFIRTLVLEISDEVKYWGIENEVDSPQFWGGTPKGYADLVQLASSEIKSNCPDCKVGISIVSPTSANGKWFEEIGKICSSIDFMDIHYYVGISMSILKDFEGSGLDRWKSTCPGADIISTETGIPSANVTFKLGKWELGGTQEKQAQDLIKYLTIMFNTGYEKAYWYLIDFSFLPDVEDDLWEHTGLLTENLVKKPAFNSYKTMIDKVDYFTSIEKLAVGQYKYTFSHKDPVYVLWCDSGTCSPPSEITGTVKVTDYLGNEQTKQASEIVLNESPVFVE